MIFLLDLLIGFITGYLGSKILKLGFSEGISAFIGLGGALFAAALYPIMNFDFNEPLGEMIASALGALILLIVAKRLRNRKS